MDELIAFFRARLDEDEMGAAAATKGPWVWDAPRGYPQQVSNSQAILIAETYADPDAPAYDIEHITRHNPARVLREVEAKRRLLEQYERVLRSKAAHDAAQAELDADLAHQEQTGVWAGPGLPDVRLQALRREEDYLNAMLPVLEGLVKAEAAVHADHKDYQEKWKP